MVSKTYHAIIDGFNRLIKDFDFNNKQNDNNEQWVNKVINEKL
jgi:hypothetical protein